jgi:hypothetical protein
MPDRAVVDERQEAYEIVERHLRNVKAWNDVGAESVYGEATYADPNEVMDWEQVLRELEPPDRALVAISEDRQWLVVLEDVFSNGGAWVIYRDAEDDVKRPWVLEAWRDDTGQSAKSVLAGWLEGRDGRSDEGE